MDQLPSAFHIGSGIGSGLHASLACPSEEEAAEAIGLGTNERYE